LFEQDTYTLSDAKRLHKQQWTAEEYTAALDADVSGVHCISQPKMLEILQLRSQYIAERGATLNNPHITKKHLDLFGNTNRVVTGPNWAAGVRQIAVDFVRAHPTHSAIVTLTSSTQL
jgi:hypothetical protein